MTENVAGIVMLYSIGLFDTFARLGIAEAAKLVQAADDVCQQQPLHLMLGSQERWEMPHLGLCTAGRLLAIMSAYIVWRQWESGITYLPDSPFLAAADTAYNLWKENEQQNRP